MVFRGPDPRSTLSQTRSKAGTETAAPGTAGQEICILAYSSWKGLQGTARAVTAQAAITAQSCPAQPSSTRHSWVTQSGDFHQLLPSLSTASSLLQVLHSHFPLCTRGWETSQDLLLCLSMQRADREPFAIRTSSPQGRIRGVQGKDKLFLLFKPKMDSFYPKTPAEDPVNQTLTSFAPKWSWPRSAWSGMGTP